MYVVMLSKQNNRVNNI